MLPVSHSTSLEALNFSNSLSKYQNTNNSLSSTEDLSKAKTSKNRGGGLSKRNVLFGAIACAAGAALLASRSFNSESALVKTFQATTLAIKEGKSISLEEVCPSLALPVMSKWKNPGDLEHIFDLRNQEISEGIKKSFFDVLDKCLIDHDANFSLIKESIGASGNSLNYVRLIERLPSKVPDRNIENLLEAARCISDQASRDYAFLMLYNLMLYKHIQSQNVDSDKILNVIGEISDEVQRDNAFGQQMKHMWALGIESDKILKVTEKISNQFDRDYAIKDWIETSVSKRGDIDKMVGALKLISDTKTRDTAILSLVKHMQSQNVDPLKILNVAYQVSTVFNRDGILKRQVEHMRSLRMDSEEILNIADLIKEPLIRNQAIREHIEHMCSLGMDRVNIQKAIDRLPNDYLRDLVVQACEKTLTGLQPSS